MLTFFTMFNKAKSVPYTVLISLYLLNLRFYILCFLLFFYFYYNYSDTDINIDGNILTDKNRTVMTPN